MIKLHFNTLEKYIHITQLTNTELQWLVKKLNHSPKKITRPCVLFSKTNLKNTIFCPIIGFSLKPFSFPKVVKLCWNKKKRGWTRKIAGYFPLLTSISATYHRLSISATYPVLVPTLSSPKPSNSPFDS